MKPRNKRSGQAVIESALILLVLLFMLFGILDFGQFFYFHQSLTERARAGARYGSVNTCAVVTNCTEAVNMAIYNDPAGSGSPLLPCLTSGCPTNATVTAAVTNSGTQNGRITVTISNYPLSFILLPWLTRSN